MRLIIINLVNLALILALTILSCGIALAEEGIVKGWSKYGSDIDGYIIGTEKADHGTVAYIKSNNPEKNKFGTLSQVFSPEEYQGQRIRFSADVKSKGLDNWAGMWLRVDSDGKTIAFDNMEDRPIKGTTDWHNLAIVLDVPVKCDQIAMGLLMSGEGIVYWDNLKIEEVGLDVPVTDFFKKNLKKGPANLNFESRK